MTEEQSCDAVCLAAQLGRLDLISALLAIIGLAIVLGGVFAFMNFKSIARRQAEKEAKEVAAAVAERIANEYMQGEGLAIIQSYLELSDSTTSDEEAQRIAEAQEQGGDEK